MAKRKVMRASRFVLALTFLCLALGICVVDADQSQFVTAKLETRSINQGLEAAVTQITAESQQPVWVAYEVPAIRPDHSVCCGNLQNDGQDSFCGTCKLEQKEDDSFLERNRNQTIKLEDASQLTVLFRVDQKRVTRIRVASENCNLDAGGLHVVWLTGVRPEESVTFLSRYVIEKGQDRDDEEGISQEALMAIAQHADASADRALASFVALGQPSSLRDKTSFWLGASRGKSGVILLEKMAKNDPSSEVRAKVAFALSVSHEPEAIDDIIRMAKDDPDAHVRGQALFWLAQMAGQKASNTITGAIQNDPDTEVKKKAVFALSQMPKEEGIPQLIQVAQTNKNPEVRKQAMFWLGQSQDLRALTFFAKILSQ
jgi:HEAT repeats